MMNPARYFLITFSALLISCGSKQDAVLENPQSSSGSSTTSEVLRWPVSSYPVVIVLPQSLKTQTETAMYFSCLEWNQALGIPLLSYRYDSGLESKDGSSVEEFVKNGIKRIYFQTIWSKISSNPNALAVTYYSFEKNILLDGDIVFNMTFPYQFDYPDGDHYDFQTILLHEMGHLIGEPHINYELDSTSVMNPYVSPGLVKRSLSIGDIIRIRSRYGL